MRWRLLIICDEDLPVRWAQLFTQCDVDELAPHALDLPAVRACGADLILAATLSPRSDPPALLRWLQANRPAAPIVAILPDWADRDLLQLAADVAADFVLWPARLEEIEQRVSRVLGPAQAVQRVGDQLADEVALRQLVGRDEAFLRAIEPIPLVARSNQPVLITGETGTGKELCARAIHHLGPRRAFPFIPVDCGAFPDHLIESEVFGHERGAFTDAYRRQRGLVAMAEGGTLFLDEIDSLSPAAQAKLLRFLQERTYRPLGSEQFLRADVHILAATNQELEHLVGARRFRADLFFRLSVLRLHMIPLRERRDDVPLLAQHVLDAICLEASQPRKTLSSAAAAELRQRPWPGNVRELNNVIQRAFVVAAGSQILPAHLTRAQSQAACDTAPGTAADDSFRAARARAIATFERQYVADLLRAHNGNITQAARRAGQDRRAFGRLVKRHRINRDALVSSRPAGQD